MACLTPREPLSSPGDPSQFVFSASSSEDRSCPVPRYSCPTSVSPSLRRSRAELGPLEPCMVRAALRGPVPGRAAVFLKYARPQRQGTSLAAACLLRHSPPGPP